MTATRRSFGLTAAGLLVTPGRARATDPILLGITLPVTGAAAEGGKLVANGANLVLDEVNKQGVLGRPLQVVAEDDQTSNPGSVLAFSRLARRSEIVAFIGSVRSTQVNSMAPDVLKTDKPMMFGSTDPSLTHAGNCWLFRCRPNDSYSAKVIAEYGTKNLGKQKWAVVHTTDTFGSNGSEALEAELKAGGLTPVLMQGYMNQVTDFSAVVLAVRQSGTGETVLHGSTVCLQKESDAISEVCRRSRRSVDDKTSQLAGRNRRYRYDLRQFGA